MASGKQGTVTLRGRFSPGDEVTLVKVAGEHVLRSEGGEEIETQTVGEEKDAPRVSYVCFTGVEVGARYFVRGLTDGRPLEVRVRGREKNDPEEVLSQPPVTPDRQRMMDGSWRDEAPTKESSPDVLAVAPDMRQVPKGTVLRSDTPRGEAHPVDIDAQEPMRRQEDVNGPVQMSDTPTGEATEIIIGAQRQEDVPKGVVQRSDTPTGVAQPFPSGDALKQQLDRESSQGRESRGGPTRAAAEPMEAKGIKFGAPTGSTEKDSDLRDAELKASERGGPIELQEKVIGDQHLGGVSGADQPSVAHEDRSGFDAQGQPAADDVAAAVGLAVPEKARVDSPGPDTAPSIKDRGKEEPEDDEPDPVRVKAGKKAAKTRQRHEAEAEKGKKSSSGPTTGAATTSNTTAKE